MNKCPRCWENNPEEVHTCTPWYHLRKCKNVQEAIDKWLLSPEDCKQYDWNNWHY